MALANYSDLVSAAANWSSRSDLTSRIPEFIALAEAKMNRRLRVKDMVTKNTAFSITGEYVAVPTSFGGVKSFWLNTSPLVVLDFMQDQVMENLYQSVSSGQPKHYNVQGANFHFGPIPDATYTATLIYYLQVPALTVSNTTNWLMTSHPDAYVYGVQAELAALAKDFDVAQGWEAKMYAVLDEVKSISQRDTYGGDGALYARPA